MTWWAERATWQQWAIGATVGLFGLSAIVNAFTTADEDAPAAVVATTEAHVDEPVESTTTTALVTTTTTEATTTTEECPEDAPIRVEDGSCVPESFFETPTDRSTRFDVTIAWLAIEILLEDAGTDVEAALCETVDVTGGSPEVWLYALDEGGILDLLRSAEPEASASLSDQELADASLEYWEGRC